MTLQDESENITKHCNTNKAINHALPGIRRVLLSVYVVPLVAVECVRGALRARPRGACGTCARAGLAAPRRRPTHTRTHTVKRRQHNTTLTQKARA